MAGVSTPEMAAAVSNAGALGSIGVGAVNSAKAQEMIQAVKQLTARAFNVNVFCHQPAKPDIEREHKWIELLTPSFSKFGVRAPEKLREIYKSFLEDDDMLQMFLSERPRVVSFHFGLPSSEKIQRLKAAGIVLIASATNLEEARHVENAGIDAVVAQGYEAGGHRGVFDIEKVDDCLGALALTRLIVSQLKVPVIAAGGIMDGAEIAEAINLGASAAQLGTAFINCPESSADIYYRAALQSDAAHHTTMTTAISGRPARCLKNLFTELGETVARESVLIPDYPIAYDAGKALNETAKAAGEGGFGAQWAGQGAARARSLPAAELIGVLKEELKAAFEN